MSGRLDKKFAYQCSNERAYYHSHRTAEQTHKQSGRGNGTLDKVKELYPQFANDSIRNLLAMANDGNGFGWSMLRIEGIKVKPGETITYGITTDPAITGVTPDCFWVSATDFILTRTDEKAKK